MLPEVLGMESASFLGANTGEDDLLVVPAIVHCIGTSVFVYCMLPCSYPNATTLVLSLSSEPEIQFIPKSDSTKYIFTIVSQS